MNPAVSDAMRSLGVERWRDGRCYVDADKVATLLQALYGRVQDTQRQLDERTREKQHADLLLHELSTGMTWRLKKVAA